MLSLLDQPQTLVTETRLVINSFNPKHLALDPHPTPVMETQMEAGFN